MIAGNFVGSIDFGGGQPGNDGTHADAYVAKLNPDGAHLWTHVYGVPAATEYCARVGRWLPI